MLCRLSRPPTPTRIGVNLRRGGAANFSSMWSPRLMLSGRGSLKDKAIECCVSGTTKC